MRTGIYVYSPITVTIQASEPIVLISFDNRTISFERGGTLSTELSPGIYKAITIDKITVTGPTDPTGPNIHVEYVTIDKDPFPDAPAKATTTFNLTTTTIKNFFVIPDIKSATF